MDPFTSPHDAATVDEHADADEPGVRRGQFTLVALLLLTFVCCVIAGGASYLFRAYQAGVNGKMLFVFFTLLAPIATIVAANLGRILFEQLQKRLG